MVSYPDLIFLETFAAVVEANGFSRAGQRLGISQPAVSYRISRLEDQLGAEVFEEPRRRVILTPAGRSLHDLSSRFLAELGTLAAEVTSGGVDLGPFKIACPGAFGRNVVFPALSQPGLCEVPVELLFRPLEEIFDLVEAGKVDLGFAYDTRVTNTLEFAHITDEEFCLIAPAVDDPLESVSLEEICREAFVTYEECDYVFGKWFNDVFGRRPEQLRTASAFSRLEEVIATVISGRGYSIVPEHAVRSQAAEGLLKLVRPKGRPLSHNPEYAVTRPGWQSRPELGHLLTEIRKTTAIHG